MQFIQPLAFCPRCGAGDLDRTHDRRIACPACQFVLYINVGAAAALIINNPDGELLLIRRAKDPGRGKLGVPGGFVDPGEPIERALRREVEEEVNLRVEAIDFLASFPNDYHFGGMVYPTIDLYFTARSASFEHARPLDEVQELVIEHPDAIADADLAFPSLRKALAVYRAKGGG